MRTTIITYTLVIIGATFTIWLFVEAMWALYYLKPELFR